MNKKRKELKHEVRVHLTPQKFEIRKNADGSRSISGYAAVFDSLSEDLGGFLEKIQPGAFKQSLIDHPDVFCIYAHNMDNILGRVSSGTLEISEDSRGLRFTCKLPDTSTARDLVELISRNDIHSMSFGFSVPEGCDKWDLVGDQVIRTLLSVVLYEISVVGQPAYTSSSVSLRSVPKALRSKLKRNDDDDLDDEAEDDPKNQTESDEERCECDCDACEEGDCEDCTNPNCDDDDCEDCLAQTRSAHMNLLLRRLRA